MVAHVERSIVLDAPASAVWEALTGDPSDWFGAAVEIEARPGGRVRVDERRGTIERFEPERNLSFRVWTPPPVEGTRIDFVLEPLDEDHTVLTVTETQLSAGGGGRVASPSARASVSSPGAARALAGA